jgi:hypothetical protein
MADRTLLINLEQSRGGKVFKLSLEFIYLENVVSPYQEVIQGEDYGVFIQEIGKKEFYYEDETLLVIPALMPFTILDVNEKLTNLIYEGAIFDPDLPDPYNTQTLTNKNIKAVFSIDNIVKLNGYLYYDNSRSGQKDATLEFNVAPRTERLKEKKITSLGYWDNPSFHPAVPINQLLLDACQVFNPDLILSDIVLLNNWYWISNFPPVVDDFSIDELKILVNNFFDPNSSIYDCLQQLAKTFFSQIFIDEQVIFKQQNLPYPIEDSITLLDDVNLRDIGKEFRYKHLDYVKITDKTPASFIVGDYTGFGYDSTINFGIYVESGFYLRTVWAVRDETIYQCDLIRDQDSDIRQAWGLKIAYQYWYFKNSAQNALLYNLEILTTETSISKGYSHNGVNYSPVSLSVDTVKEEGEVKCLKLPSDADAPGSVGLYSSEGYLLHDCNNVLIEEYPE